MKSDIPLPDFIIYILPILNSHFFCKAKGTYLLNQRRFKMGSASVVSKKSRQPVTALIIIVYVFKV